VLRSAAELLDACLVDAFDNDTTNHRAGDGGIAEPLDHHSLYAWGRRIQDAVFDVIARKDRADLFAVGAPPRIVQSHALAAPRLGRSWGEQEQHGRQGRGDPVTIGIKSRHLASVGNDILSRPILCCT
jgi:hypothetical protein